MCNLLLDGGIGASGLLRNRTLCCGAFGRLVGPRIDSFRWARIAHEFIHEVDDMRQTKQKGYPRLRSGQSEPVVPKYLTLIEVAVRLRLGGICRPRKGQPVLTSDEERRVRSARHLVKRQGFPTTVVTGQLLVLESAVAEFEAGEMRLSGRSFERSRAIQIEGPETLPVDSKQSNINHGTRPNDHSAHRGDTPDHSGNHS